MNRILLISENQIKEMSLLEMNVDSKALKVLIWDNQLLKLSEVLGAELYDKVCQEATAKYTNPEFAMTTESLLNNYIKPYLTYIVLQDWIVSNNYKLTNKGVLKLNDSSSNSLTSTELEYIKDQYDNKAMAFKNNLVKYLKEQGLSKGITDTDVASESIGWYFG